MSKQIAYRFFGKASAPYYVSELPGEGGVDWGYSPDVERAKVLNRNQWQSFAKYMRETNGAAFALARD